MSPINEVKVLLFDSVLTSNILRKAHTIAVQQKNEVFKKWIEKELFGYKDNDILPAYRQYTNDVWVTQHRGGFDKSETKNAIELFGTPIAINKSVKDFEYWQTDGHGQNVNFLVEITKSQQKTLASKYGFTENSRCYINRVEIGKIIEAIRYELSSWLYEIDPEEVKMTDKKQPSQYISYNISGGNNAPITTQAGTQNSTQKVEMHKSKTSIFKRIFKWAFNKIKAFFSASYVT